MQSDVVVDMGHFCLQVTRYFRKNAGSGDVVHLAIVVGCPGHTLDPVAWGCDSPRQLQHLLQRLATWSMIGWLYSSRLGLCNGWNLLSARALMLRGIQGTT